jgi:hypothetical protein
MVLLLLLLLRQLPLGWLLKLMLLELLLIILEWGQCLLGLVLLSSSLTLLLPLPPLPSRLKTVGPCRLSRTP